MIKQYVFKHKDKDVFGQWWRCDSGRWTWLTSTRFPLTSYELPDTISVKAASLSCGPHSQYGEDTAEHVDENFKLIEWSDNRDSSS